MGSHNQYKLIMTEGPTAGEIYPIEQDEVVLGRESGVDILIDSPGISRRHARIFVENNQYTLEDLGSSNGTFLNGERLRGRLVLKPGDEIRLGRTVALIYEAEQPQVDATMLDG